MALSRCAGSLRATSLFLVLSIALPAASSAQEVAPVPMVHEVRERPLIAGASVLAVGYVGAAIWGSYYLASLHLGVLSCNDIYGGLHFLPVAGPVAGMFSGGACVPDQLHLEEAIMPVVFSVVQLTGVILLVIGAVGREVPDLPSFSLQMTGNGGSLTVGGSF